MKANINHVTANTSIGYNHRNVNYTGFGHGCDVTAEFGLAVGAYAYVCEPCGVALGPYTRVKHENSVVIGQHIESKNHNSVLISDVEFRNGSISIENDKLLILGNNINADFKCEGCDETIKSGVRWSSETLYQMSEPAEATSGLCFNCIRDCVLQFRAKEAWANEFGDPISELKKDIQELKEKMKKWKNIECFDYGKNILYSQLMQTVILPGTFIKSLENLNEFIRKGTVLRVTEVVVHQGSKIHDDNLIATTYVCKYEDPRVTIKIKLFDFIIEPSGQEREATIYPITRQGWKIKK